MQSATKRYSHFVRETLLPHRLTCEASSGLQLTDSRGSSPRLAPLIEITFWRKKRMQALLKCAKVAAVFALAVFVPGIAKAQHYTQKNLVSDISQPDNADGSKVLLDPNLRNPWGLTRSSGSPR